jgi:hypothetical protein
MRLGDPQGLHERGHIVGEQLGGILACRLVAFARPAQVDRHTGEMLGILSHLEGVAGVVSCQIGNEDQWFSGSLLLIVYGDVIGLDFGHGSLSL